MSPILIKDSKMVKDFISSMDTFLFDCDGVLWHGDQLLPNVRETLELLKKLGKQCVFVTNNSTKSRSAYAQKFHSLGLDFVTKEDIFGVAYGAACYLKDIVKFPVDKKVFVIGQDGITDELEAQSIAHYTVHDDHLDFLHHGPGDFKNGFIEAHDNVAFDCSSLYAHIIGAVLIGYDALFSYRKLSLANYYLREGKNCLFIATNRDSSYPTPFGIFPGTGCIVAAVAVASGQEPLVIGKPQQTFLDCILKRMHLMPEKTCMVGDRLDTDILFGLKGNLHTLLVLTGIAQETDFASTTDLPEYYIPSLGTLQTLYHDASSI